MLPPIKITRREGDILPPWYYGLSYVDLFGNRDVFHVMPLNWIIRWGRWISHRWNWLRGKPSWMDNEIIKAYNEGYLKALQPRISSRRREEPPPSE